MKTLIINGSPRKNGDTAFLLSKFRKNINHQIVELSVYESNIQPCNDCRACQKEKGCKINDDMRVIYNDDFDNVLIASPLYISNLTPPLVSLASRLQAYYCAKRFLRDAFYIKEKKSALILVGGGDGSPSAAINLSSWIFKQLNADEFDKNRYTAFSLKTDDILASEDAEAIKKVQEIALYFNGDKLT